MRESKQTPDTRTRILVATLSLFNEHGEAGTSTNEIADEVDISPGNLHYHFRKKADLIDALLQEFKADARRVLDPPDVEAVSIDDFWLFLHLLLETMAAYRFLVRDAEILASQYANVRHSLKIFARGLVAVIELYLEGMRKAGILTLRSADIAETSRIIAIITLFSERFDSLVGTGARPDASAAYAAIGVLNVLLPYAETDSAAALAELARQYR